MLGHISRSDSLASRRDLAAALDALQCAANLAIEEESNVNQWLRSQQQRQSLHHDSVLRWLNEAPNHPSLSKIVGILRKINETNVNLPLKHDPNAWSHWIRQRQIACEKELQLLSQFEQELKDMKNITVTPASPIPVIIKPQEIPPISLGLVELAIIDDSQLGLVDDLTDEPWLLYHSTESLILKWQNVHAMIQPHEQQLVCYKDDKIIWQCDLGAEIHQIIPIQKCDILTDGRDYCLHLLSTENAPMNAVHQKLTPSCSTATLKAMIQTNSLQHQRYFVRQIRLYLHCCSTCDQLNQFLTSLARDVAAEEDTFASVLNDYYSASLTSSPCPSLEKGSCSDSPLSQQRIVAAYEKQFTVQRWIRVALNETRDLRWTGRHATQSNTVAHAPSVYALIWLGDVIVARVPWPSETAQGQQIVPWHWEQFIQDSAPCLTPLRLAFYERRRTRTGEWCLPQLIGWMQLRLPPFGDVSTTGANAVIVDGWYPLMTQQELSLQSLSSTTPSPGHVRLRISVGVQRHLTRHDYEPLIQMLQQDIQCDAINQIASRVKMNEDSIHALVHIFLNEENGVSYLVALARHAINQTDDANIIFRGNSLASKSIDYFMKQVALPYLQDTLKSCINDVYMNTKPCELEQGRLESMTDNPAQLDKMRQESQAMLKMHCENIFSAIASSVPNCPSLLRQVLSEIWIAVKERFPHNSQVPYSAVSGFIFLRFWCAAVLSPMLFGLQSGLPLPINARLLTLMAKTLQNLANQVEFDHAKEPHMRCMNEFIVSHMDAMRLCIVEYTDHLNVENENAKLQYDANSVDMMQDWSHLSCFYLTHLDTLRSIPDANVNAMIPHLERLQAMYKILDEWLFTLIPHYESAAKAAEFASLSQSMAPTQCTVFDQQSTTGTTRYASSVKSMGEKSVSGSDMYSNTRKKITSKAKKFFQFSKKEKEIKQHSADDDQRRLSNVNRLFGVGPPSKKVQDVSVPLTGDVATSNDQFVVTELDLTLDLMRRPSDDYSFSGNDVLSPPAPLNLRRASGW